MGKIMFVILFCMLFISSKAQMNIKLTPSLVHTYNYDYFEINIQIENGSEYDMVLFLQNWRTYLLDKEKLIHCLPVMDNYLVNRLYFLKDSTDIFKKYIGEEESPLVFSNGTLKKIQPKDRFDINLIITDKRFIEKIKENSYYLSYLFSYFKYEELNDIFPEGKDYYTDQPGKTILIKKIDIDQEYKNYNFTEKAEKYINDLGTTTKLKKIVKNNTYIEKIGIPLAIEKK